jgi:hypothetical protein
MGAVAGNLYGAGAQLVGDYFFGKSARDAAKDAAKAQEKVADLQAEEQRLKNQILQMDIADRNKQLPLAVSLPGRSYGTGAVPTATDVADAPVMTAGLSGWTGILAVGGLAALLLLRR